MSGDYEELPHDLEAERAVLGAAMLSPEAAGLVVDGLTPRHFYRAAHQVVFECIDALTGRAEPVEAVAVKAELERRRPTGEQVNPLMLFDMTASVVVTANTGYYVQRLNECHYRRELFMAGKRLKALGLNGGADVDDVADQAGKILDAVSGVSRTASGRPLSESMPDFLTRLEVKAEDRGVTTGWRDLDGLLGKLRPGHFVVIGARPRMGKSLAMGNMAMHAGVDLKQPVLFASLEMSEDEIQSRMLAHRGKVVLNKIQNRVFGDDDWIRLATAGAELSGADRLIIDDEPGISVARLREKLSAMRRAGEPAAVVFVDYVQLMVSPKKTESRQQELSEISRSLKLLAKEYEVPIVAGAQLNRGPEQRTNKRPMLGDLRESGALENDADVVILLHREDAYEPESPRAGEIDLIVAKNRHGPTGTITAAFQGHYSRIADMAPEPSRPWSPTSSLENR